MGTKSVIGKIRQVQYDAVKKMRETGEAWLTLNNKRIKIVPVPDHYMGPYYSFPALIVSKKGNLISGEVIFKDGVIFISDDGRLVLHPKDKQILARIAESHDR